ncbi:hypothetical protein A0H81_11684 [Grifola frondosa]|uniref:PI-PLC X domain-containing protein 1 n=1 Tax=Grifola frondosa TaxID=5627 RepID=A0A1C7LUI7_GRIFR|nr:hypothetical protein A0H81_11684 [Grifola frondosa]
MHISTKHLTQGVLSLLLSSAIRAAAHAVSPSRRATVCNGHSELCDRSFANVTFVGAHDSYAVGTNNLAANQDYNVTQQLNDGVRMLQLQAHNSSGVIELCHTSCILLDGGTLEDYLTKVKTWMDSNPNDVVSLLIVNSDNLAPSLYNAVFQSAGIDTLAYSPSQASLPASSWPTLGSLIDSGKRLVAFLTTTANFTSVPYLIDEFSNMWETAYDLTDATAFDCNVNRSNGDTTTQMFLINHFLDTIVAGFPAPDSAQANTTNAVSGVGSLGQQVETCVAQYGKNPNFMLVDFYEYGNGSVFQVAATANGVTYDPTTPVAAAGGPTSSSGSNGASGLRITNIHLTASLAVVGGLLLGSIAIV